jgi:hypothetical protein
LIQNVFGAGLGKGDRARFTGDGVEMDEANAVALEAIVTRCGRIVGPRLSPQAGQDLGLDFRIEVGFAAGNCLRGKKSAQAGQQKSEARKSLKAEGRRKKASRR